MHLSHLVETIDTHTAGNPTRNLIAGVPRIEGKTMQDKMAYAEEHLDWLRTAVMMEPRGHSNMSGTIWVEPCHPEADMGILFIDAGGHMPMCGHSTIGCVTAMLESGRVRYPSRTRAHPGHRGKRQRDQRRVPQRALLPVLLGDG